MKKLLFVFPVIALLAAGCSSVQQANIQQNTQSSMPSPQQQKTQPPILGLKTKSVDLAGKYTIEVPLDFTAARISKDITTVPEYGLRSPDVGITISIYPYAFSESQIPGQCVASKDFDNGTLSAPIFCEEQNLINSFIISGNRYVKYGTEVRDTSMDCTMNSPCPIKVPAKTRYSKEYVFAVPDKSHGSIVEFFVGDAASGPTNTVNGFEGASAILHDII